MLNLPKQESLGDVVTHAAVEFSTSVGISEKVTRVGLFPFISWISTAELFPLASFISTAWDIEDCRGEDEGSTYQINLLL